MVNKHKQKKKKKNYKFYGKSNKELCPEDWPA